MTATSTSMGDGEVLAFLRHVTGPAHKAIEGTLGLTDECLSLLSYKAILERLYGFWWVWEPQMARLLQDETFLKPRRRLHLLAADLAALGMSPEFLEILPLCPPVLLYGVSEALGSLYVMEGSTLGGRVILKNVERRLGAEGRGACSYFRGYGDDTGLMWLSFLSRLNAVSKSEQELVGRGALETFERLRRWMATA